MRQSLVKSGVVPAAWAAGLVLSLAACVPQISQQTVSPPASPSAAAVTPGTAPTPAESPAATASPTAIASPSPAKLIITTLPFHVGEVGLNYGTVTLGAAGGVKPYKWSISSGALPLGLTLSTGGNTTGTPTAIGNFSFVARVDDSAGAAAGVSRSILVFRQIAFVTKYALCAGSYGVPCTASLRYSGGRGGIVTAHITAIAPIPCSATRCFQAPPPGKAPYTAPPGFTASGSGGALTVSEPADCKQTCPNGGYWRLTLTLTDSSACGAGFICTSSNTAVVDVEMAPS